MENKTIESTNKRPEGNHIIDASIVKIDIPALAKQIKNETPWTESDRNAITVFKTNGLSIVLIALHKDAVMPKYQAHSLINIQVLDGEIEFSTDEESVNLTKGQILAVHCAIPHSILAVEETVFLLTVTTTKKQFTD
jgi:quercetin dioxygenase-like cupin family protein